MRKNQNRNRKAGKHLSAKPKLMSSANAAGPEATPDPVSDGGTDNFTTQQSGADAATPAEAVQAAATPQADNVIPEAFAEPSTSTDDALQETQTEADPAGPEMQVHPLAKIFPLPSEDDLRSLAEDIKQNGLLEPITTFQGVILDGRCRYLACGRAGVEPKFEEYAGADHIGFVVSKNVRRRHLTESQRAMAAAKLADLPVGGNQYSEGLSIGRAAERFDVGERSVARAKEVLRCGDPELVEAVESGRMPVSVAAKKCRAPGSVQGPSEAGQQGEVDIEGRDQTVHSDHKPAQVDEKATSESASSCGDSCETAVMTEAMLAAAGPPITPDESGSNVDVDAAVDAGAEAADEAAFERLATTWAAASDSVRHRFVTEIVVPFNQPNTAA